jgi:hypothetical protein
MKKIFALAMTGSLFFAACTKADLNDDAVNDLAPSTGRKCGSYEVLEQQMAADPTLRIRMQQIEEFTQRTIADPVSYRLLSDGTMEIPVVFNVLYNTAAQNLSLTQLQSQIDVLNEDYSATNTDYNNTPSIFQSVRAGDTRIRFVLDQVVRKQTNKTSWTTNDAMKKSAQGGIDATSPTTKLNIWVCNLSGGILGYAQFPGGKAATDGVVLDDNATGRTGTVTAPYNKGRTATHEIGHWFNLRHIWGDATCGNDLVNDTPLHNAANYGCPAAGHKSTCTGTPVEMTMNYMDYTDDACMYMFTAGQKARMQATYAIGGPRASFR